jgi:hypothetical protein
MSDSADASEPICPLCLRPIPQGAPQSLHHLVPKLKGGKGGRVVLLHHICHKEIHARFRESVLARQLNTPDALRAAPELQDFLAWIARRPPEFTSRVKKAPR